ncbi:MAG: NADPH:quinone reductase, partial [Opitutaceae bacterium]
PAPTVEAGQVLVRLHAIGINPVDTYLRSGVYPRKPALPYTPGSDGAGMIEAVGAGVTSHKPGDRVYVAGSSSGTYAELALCDAARVHALPERVSFAQGAAVGVPYGTAYRGLVQRGGFVAGETVLVHGASGGVGIAAVQIARALGARVIGTAGTERGRQLVAEQGAHEVFDHGAPDYLERIRTAAAPHGVNVILEMLANVNLGKDLPLLAQGGRVVVIGSRGKVEIQPRDLMSCDGDIRAMTGFNISPEDHEAIHAAIVAGLENDTLRPVVGRELPLAEAAEAHRAVMQDGAFGKIVLRS